MKKMLKITGVVIGVLVVLAIVLLVAAKLIITPERVRKTVLPLAEKSLHRQVSIGDIGISLFSGISIENLRVMMKDEKETFVSAESLVLKYRLWPLIKKQVVIDEARLKKPEIRVVRNKDGVFNFSDLIEGGKGKKSMSAKASVAAAQEKGGGPAIDLLVSRVRITDGNLLFTDRFAAREPVSSRISRLEVAAQNISMKEPFPFEINGRLNHAPVSLSGNVYPAEGKVRADVRVRDLNLVDFEPYIKDKLPGRISSANLGLEASVEVTPDKASSLGIITADRVDMALDALPDAPFRNARFAVDHDITVELGRENLKILKAVMDINGISLTASGTVSGYGSKPELDISVNLPETEVQNILSAIPAGLVRDTKAEKAGGRVEANGRISGVVSKPVHVTHTIKADRLDLDYLIALTGGPGGKGSQDDKNDAEKSGGSEKQGGRKIKQNKDGIGPFDIPVHAEGRIQVGNARYRGLPIKDLLVEYALIDNLFTVKKFSADVAEGRAKGEASINLGQKEMDYTANFDMSSIQSGKVISVLYPKASWFVSGTAGMDGRFSGKGIRMPEIRKNLTGRANYQISNGRVSGGDATRELAALLGASELETLDFEMFKGNLRIDSGKVKIDGDYESKELRMKPSGFIGLDGSLSLALNLRLAPGVSTSLSSDNLVGRLLADKEGWAYVPVAVSGSLASPRLVLESSRIKEQLKEKATEKVLEKAFQKLFD
ncbi:MAG: AsmA family protein [Desulfobacteraceae bacterium]|nr:AsmA family protein [Desulfobacteraceae bacterium]